MVNLTFNKKCLKNIYLIFLLYSFEELTNDDTDFNERVNSNISVYICVGFGCLLFSYLFNVCFNTGLNI